MKTQKIYVDDSIKFAYIYSHQTNLYKSIEITQPKGMFSLKISNHLLDWVEFKQQNSINLSEFTIIFLDGCNNPKHCEAILIGDQIADYVDNGGIVCTLECSNIENAYYTVKGRWESEIYQPLRS